MLSSNSHDRDLEAAMAGAFVFGPLAALVGFVVGVIKGGARPASAVAERKIWRQSPP